jgi:hypothetical protein
LLPAEPLTRYLLGSMPEEERSRVEERLFSDDELHEELQATADDLIHAYLQGALTADERSRFESHFLASPPHRRRVEFLRDLLAAVHRVSPEAAVHGKRRAWWTWAVAAALVVAVAATLRPRPGGTVTQTRMTRAIDPSVEPLNPRPPSPPPPPSADPVVRIPRNLDGQPFEIALSPGTQRVRLDVTLPDRGSPSYDVVLRAARGALVWRAGGLEPTAPGRLLVRLPGRVLAAGVYTLVVRGEKLRDGGPASAPFAVRLRFVAPQRQSP